MIQAEWRRLYLVALAETDSAKIASRIQEAETAMFLQIENLAEYSHLESERESIASAFAALRALQRTLSYTPRSSLTLMREKPGEHQ
jgi:pyruvate/2-oxoacid:ferredoxin oxidoreductase alpha subunit